MDGIGEPGRDDPPPRLPRAVVIAAGLALAAKLWLAWTTSGTNDVEAFRTFLRELLGSGAAGLYRDDPDFNHPPFVLHVLRGLRWLVNATGLPFPFCLRAPSILADAGSVWLVWRILGARPSDASVRTTLVLVAAAPASILISGFHGNTDPVMVFFVLLSMFWIEKPGRLLLAGAAMGMAVNVKVVPLVFWPAVLLWLPGWGARLRYFGATLGVVALASAPIAFQEPALVARKVLGYPSSYNDWGLPWVLAQVRGPFPVGEALFQSYGRLALAVCLLALAVWMNRGGRRPPLFRQIGATAFAFLAITPGFAVQYLAWLVPWVAGIPIAAAAAFLAASGAFLVLVYTYWCQAAPFVIADPNWLGAHFWSAGLPWDFASALQIGLWRGELVPVAMVCWLSVVWALVAQLRALSAPPERSALHA